MTVSSKGLMNIPSELRRKFNLRPGTKLRLIERGGIFIMVPVSSLDSLYGLGTEHKQELLEAIVELEKEHDEAAKSESTTNP